jgi:nitrous oxidase accessory protein NosD
MKTRKSLLVILTVFFIGAVAAGFLYAGGVWKDSQQDATGLNEIASNGNVQGELYPGNPSEEAQLVEREDERLVYVRTIASAARWRVDGLDGPYQLRTGSTHTLVLPARTLPYTTADLIQLLPDKFQQVDPTTYLLSENVIVLPGANLTLNSPEGLTIRLKSDSDAFVSIVALGGSLTLTGTEASDTSITSWDTTKAQADTETADGRAYVRVIGGHAAISYATVSALGFWSGNTGGLALTGTDTVSTFKDEPAQPPVDTGEGTESSGPWWPTATLGARLLPEEDLSSLLAKTDQDYSVVTAGIDNLRVSGNAFGLFVTNARDVAIRDTRISGSLVDGLVLHRSVTDATITATTSSDNAVDGITVGRSSTRVGIEKVTTEGNGRNGITLDGQPLADGPNAVGTAVSTYGGNRVSGSTVLDNGRYGVEVSGGDSLEVAGNTIGNNEVGVVVNYGAKGVDIINNELRDQRKQAIAVRDAEAFAVIRSNDISGGDTGIYVRDAGASITHNTLSSISNHGITLLGSMESTRVAHNNVGGYGSTAIWDENAFGATIEENYLLDWHPAPTVTRVVNSVFQPLTFIWLILAALLVATALTRKRHLRVRTIGNPYAERVPLTALSRGVLNVEDHARPSQ